MKYENIVKGKFISRPNRFIANVIVDGKEEKAHVKNTGRCKEILTEGATIYLEDFKDRMGTRKMRYSLITVEKGDLLVNIDSQAPNKVCEEALLDGTLVLPGMEKLSLVKREKTFGDSRFDFYLEAEDGTKGWLEVKGVTLEHHGHTMFPDAPTVRGVKHIYELCKAAEQGYKAYILFIVQMDGMKSFSPNDATQPEFGEALRFAKKNKVKILIYGCKVSEDMLILDSSLTESI